MTTRIAYCMHRGNQLCQQDALLVQGEVRQSRNLRPQEKWIDDEILIALADGVAASPNAHLASHFVLSELPRVLRERAEWCHDGLMNGRHLREMHARLCEELANRPQMYGGSTTIVAAHIKGRHAAVVNTGDSRAYLRRRDGSVCQLSKDHTELQRLRDAGEADATTEYASLFSALSDCLIADSEEGGFEIHVVTLILAPDDVLLLCTDGVHDVLGDTPWQTLIAQHSDPLTLVQAARSALLADGAYDNFSMIALMAQA